MNEKSKGINRSIDLTEDNVFRDGVLPSFLCEDKGQLPTDLPWDNNGEIQKQNTRFFDNIFKRLNNTIGFNDMYTDDEFKIDGYSQPLTIELINYYLDKWTNEGKYSLLGDTISALLRTGLEVTFSKNIGEKISFELSGSMSSFPYLNQINQKSSYNTSYMISRANKYNTCDLYTTDYRFSYFYIAKYVKYDDIVQRNMIHTCSASEYANYREEYNMVLRIIESQKDIDNKSDKNVYYACKCGNIYNKIYNNRSYECPECALKSYYSFDSMRRHAILKLSTEFKRDVTLYRKPIKYDDLYDVLHASVSVYADLNNGEDESMDYFHQKTYRDRGIHLIRIPSNSHEMRVGLNGKIYDDDDSDEKRNTIFSSHALSFNVY